MFGRFGAVFQIYIDIFNIFPYHVCKINIAEVIILNTPIGLSEIAQMANITAISVNSRVKSLLRKRGKNMGTKIISFINLKGGVAKTTTTVGVATVLAGEKKKKVLVVDLDPQTNCTTMLIGENKWKELNVKGHTLYTLFKDALKESSDFNLSETLQQNVSKIRNVKGLDLIPSSLDMIDIQDQIATIPRGQFYSNNPTEIIKKALYPIIDNYDYILIDCPPNMGLITLNGLCISDGYIIPTIPDILSTYGIPQIINRVDKFSKNIGKKIACLGIVATKVRLQSPLHQRTLKTLKNGKDAPLFHTIFCENNQIGEAAECTPVSTLRQKWGYQGQFQRFNAFANEIMEKMEV